MSPPQWLRVTRAASIIAALSIALASGASAGGFDDGAAPYERCALCHGLFGDSPRAKFPKLAGQRPGYLARQINAFLSGHRSNDGGQMVSVVTELSTDDMTAVVDWFSTQDHPAPKPTDAFEHGQLLYMASGCYDCHDETASGPATMPFLSAQHPDYLAKQMREIRDGLRPSDSKGEMRAQLDTLSDAEIELIAAYLAALERPE